MPMNSEPPTLGAIPMIVLHLNRQGVLLDFKSTDDQPTDLPIFTVGKNIEELFPKSFVDQFQGFCLSGPVNAGVHHWEYEIPGNHLRHYQEACLSPVGSDQFIVIIRDITDQKWSTEASRHSEHYYKQLIRNLQVGVLIQAPNGEILLSNLVAQKLLGFSEKQLLGNRLTELDFEITGESDSATIIDTLRDTIAHCRPLQNLAVCVNHPESNYRAWMLVNIVPEFGLDGAAEYVVVTLSEITDFKNAEAALRTSEEQYELLINSINEVIFLLDDKGCWIFLNAAWEFMTGYSRFECIGQHLEAIVYTDDYDRVRNIFRSLLNREKGDCREDIRFVTKEQGLRWVEIRMRLISNESGDPIGYTGTLSDINDRKLSEENLLRLAVQSRIVGAQRQLLSNISHDIRTPISVIGTSTYLMRKKAGYGNEGQIYLDRIEEQIRLLTQVLEKTTTFAELIQGSVIFDYAKTQINDLIRQAVLRREHEIAQKQQRIELSLHPDIPFVEVDREWILVMLDSLLQNCVQYTPANGTISITTAQELNSALITIRDTGIGIESEDLNHIFEPFYKGDKSRSENLGSFGLGLSVAKSVIDLHGGSILMDSERGKGTTVTLRLPTKAQHKSA